MVEIMTSLLIGKHFWIALVLATPLLKIVIAPLRIRRSAPLRSAPLRSAPHRSAPLRTDLRRIASHRLTRYRHTHIEITRHTFDAVTWATGLPAVGGVDVKKKICTLGTVPTKTDSPIASRTQNCLDMLKFSCGPVSEPFRA